MSPRRGRQVEWPLLSGLITATVISAIVAMIGFQAQLSFFGEGSDEEFSGWTHMPLLIAGGIGIVLSAAALVSAHISRHRYAREAAITAAVAAMIVLGGGGWICHVRSHPQGFERAAVARLEVPSNASTDITTVGSSPQDDLPTAGPSGYGPPVAVRSWGTTDCAALRQVVSAWADPGSVHAPPPLELGPPCFWFARYQGWQVAALILDEHTSGTAQVIISPPTVPL